MPLAARLYLAVGLGAALGSVARALVSLGMLHLLGPGLAWGTLAVNVLGSFLIGLHATLTEPGGRLIVGPAARLFVQAGFCGGFTTFSVFSLETLFMAAAGELQAATLHVGLSVMLWLAAVWLGYQWGARLNRRPGR